MSLTIRDITDVTQSKLDEFLDSRKLQTKIKETMQGDFFTNIIIEQLNNYILNEKINSKVEAAISGDKINKKINYNVEAAISGDKINQKIDERIFIKLNNNFKYLIPEEVKTYLDKNLEFLVQKLVANYLKLNMSTLTLEHVKKVLPEILDDSPYMNQILMNHSNSLNQQLENTARSYLAAITMEDQYHLINEQYFNNFDQRANQHLTNFHDKGDIVINTVNHNVKTFLNNIDKQNEEKIKVINKDYESKTADLKRCIEENNILKSDIIKLKLAQKSFVNIAKSAFVVGSIFSTVLVFLYINK